MLETPNAPNSVLNIKNGKNDKKYETNMYEVANMLQWAVSLPRENKNNGPTSNRKKWATNSQSVHRIPSNCGLKALFCINRQMKTILFH